MISFQLFVDHRFFPEVTLAILHPLEIRSGGRRRRWPRMSGITKHAFCRRGCSSAAESRRSVWPPSARMRHFTRLAIAAGDDGFSVAAGMRIFAIGDQQLRGVALFPRQGIRGPCRSSGGSRPEPSSQCRWHCAGPPPNFGDAKLLL